MLNEQQMATVDPLDPSLQSEPVPELPEPRRPFLIRMGTGLRRIGRIFRRRAPTEKNPTTGLKVLIVTDAWKPQVNGVVRTLDTLGTQLTKFGNEVRYITPDMFRTIPMPSYPEIRLALAPNWKIARIINKFEPDAIHIATEGPLGLAARRFCVRREHPFTSSFHTRFPEYLNARTGFPVSWGYKWMRWFHGPASALMVKTDSLKEELEAKGYENIKIWRNGVDLELFRPGDKDHLDLPRPIWLYVGRVAVEKNIEAFLDLDLPGTKVVVGDGPQKAALEAKHPEAKFLGFRFGEELPASTLRAMFCVPFEDGYVRSGQCRGAGLRHSGRCLRCSRPARHSRRLGRGRGQR